MHYVNFTLVQENSLLITNSLDKINYPSYVNTLLNIILLTKQLLIISTHVFNLKKIQNNNIFKHNSYGDLIFDAIEQVLKNSI